MRKVFDPVPWLDSFPAPEGVEDAYFGDASRPQADDAERKGARSFAIPARKVVYNGKPGSRTSQPKIYSSSQFWCRSALNYINKSGYAISGQDGHRKTFSVACILVIGFDLRADEALSVLKQWNLGCKPQWNTYDLESKIEDAIEKRSEHHNPGYLRENLRQILNKRKK